MNGRLVYFWPLLHEDTNITGISWVVFEEQITPEEKCGFEVATGLQLKEPPRLRNTQAGYAYGIWCQGGKSFHVCFGARTQ